MINTFICLPNQKGTKFLGGMRNNHRASQNSEYMSFDMFIHQPQN
jgi:hypothetical protein